MISSTSNSGTRSSGNSSHSGSNSNTSGGGGTSSSSSDGGGASSSNWFMDLSVTEAVRAFIPEVVHGSTVFQYQLIALSEIHPSVTPGPQFQLLLRAKRV